MILGLLGLLKCSDTGDWPEAEFSFPCDIFCFEGTYVAAVARNQAVISEEKVFSFWNSKAKVGVVVDINCEGLGFLSDTSKESSFISFKALAWVSALEFVILEAFDIVC